MENIEFIAASELPVTEAKEVNVLCLDNGELKQKAAGNLGGGGGYVIHIPAEDIKNTSETSIEIELTQSRDDFAELLYNGGSVWLDMSALGIPGAAVAVTVSAFMEGVLTLLAVILISNLTVIQVTCPNGTWTPPED